MRSDFNHWKPGRNITFSQTFLYLYCSCGSHEPVPLYNYHFLSFTGLPVAQHLSMCTVLFHHHHHCSPGGAGFSVLCLNCTLQNLACTHKIRIRLKGRQRSSLLVGGRISDRMIWRKGWIEECILGRTDALDKLGDYLVHPTPTPNHHPPKMDVLPKTFCQIILATK